MPASISPTPTYPIPGERVEIAFSGLDAATNAVQLFAVTAPSGSALDTRIKESTKNRVRVFDGDTATKWIFQPDKGGVYTFSLEELTRVSPSLGMFAGDLGGTSLPTAVATTTVTLEIGQKLSHQLGTSQDSAELIVFVWGSHIRQTTLASHGIATPAIINPSSPAAAAAAEDGDVVAQIATFVGSTCDALANTMTGVFAGIRDAYQTHANAGGAHHNVNDDVNTVDDGVVATNPKATEAAINFLRQQFAAHLENPLNAAGTTRPHDSTDTANALVSSGASSDPATFFPALIDLYIALENHATTGSPVHNSAATPVMPTLGPLMTLHKLFFEAIADAAATPPAATNRAVTVLGKVAGFKEI